MAGEWTQCALGDLIELKRGYDLPQQDRRPGAVPIVSSSGVTDYHAEAMKKGPGVVTGRYGTLGQVLQRFTSVTSRVTTRASSATFFAAWTSLRTRTKLRFLDLIGTIFTKPK